MEGEDSSLRRHSEGAWGGEEWTQGATEGSKDPYDEIEMYLNKAKEDIFIAIKSSSLEYLPLDLEDDDRSESPCDNLSVTNSGRLVDSPGNRFWDSSPVESKLDQRSPLLKRTLVNHRRPRKFGLTQDHRRPSSLKDSRLQEWSQGLLKDFQDIVEEELKSLSSPALEKEEYLPATNSISSAHRISSTHSISSTQYVSENYQSIAGHQRTNLVTENFIKNVSDDVHRNLNGDFINADEIMGGNQSSIKVPEDWEEDFYTHYKTYSLPRSSQRSVSLVGERLASSGHPEDRSEPCQLISVTHHRFSRSLSLDEGRGLSPWAMEHLRLIDDAHRSQKEIHFTADPNLSLPEGIYGKIRKTGGNQGDNEKLFIANIHSDSPLPETKRLSNGWTPHEAMIALQNAGGRDLAVSGSEPDSPKLDLNSSTHDSDLDKFHRETRRSSITSGTSSALTIEALGERNGEGWVYADEDDSCLLPDHLCDNPTCQTGKGDEMIQDNRGCPLSRPEIVITSPDINSLEHIYNSTQTKIEEVSDTLDNKGKQRKLRDGGGRKSEPSFPSPRVVSASPLLGLPGLEVRRHTLPNPANKNGPYSNVNSFALDVSGTPIFNTSSWETLPPAEEMEIMENKPIQVDEVHHLSLERPSSRTKSITSSRSLNSSLSSLSQLSLQDDFSENELWSPGSKSPDSKSSNSTENLLVENSFSPEVFLDPSHMYPSRGTNDFLNNLNKDRNQEENSLKGVFVDTKPVIIKLSPKVIKDVRISTKEDVVDTRKIFHETHSSLLKNILFKETDEETKAALKDKDIKSFKHEDEKFNNSPPSPPPESLSGVLQLTPDSQSSSNELIFTVTISESCPANNQCSEVGAESDSCNNTLDRRKCDNDFPSRVLKENPEEEVRKNFESFVITEQERLQDSIQEESDFVPVGTDDPDKVERRTTGDNRSKAKEENGDDDDDDDDEEEEVVLPPLKQINYLEKPKRNSKGKSCTKGTFADLQLFLKEVETRIPSSKEAVSSTSFGSVRSPVTPSSVLSQSSGELLSLSPSFPTVVLDASTQTSFSPSTPACGSPTFSFTWMSDCGCDGASLEPCASSIALSGTEDDLDEEDECDMDDDEEDDWWVTEGSLSSSPPETPVSPVRDDSSLSLSESLDNLDQNVESGIGTVSTRPSTSPPVICGALDLSGSNLSSEDTGLETSFERRVRRYLPNARCGRFSDHSSHYRRRRPLARPADSWVRRENQTTQTELLREIRASSEEAQGRPWTEDAGAQSEESQLVRHTHSEPRLSALSNPNLSLRGVSSEATLPPLPHSHSHSRSFCSPSPLPTLSEVTSFNKVHFSRPRNLSLGEVHVPSKAISAPVLERGILRPLRSASATSPSDESSLDTTFMPTRTQSEKEISEIEALEACKWLRAAGFPQYAQMYEDFQFPLDLVSVERDHSFLDVDSLQALFRRLRILNRCAKIRLDSAKKGDADDSEDEEQQCALSGNWTFQRHSRRWSRIDTTQLQIPPKGVDLRACGSDRVRGISEGSDEVIAGQFKRSGSERLKDGAKAFLRRMESLKNKKKRRHREGIVISSPKVLDEALMQVRMTELGCIDISPEGSPHLSQRDKGSFRDATEAGDSRVDVYTARDSSKQTTPGEDSSSLASDQSQSSTPRFRTRRRKRFWRKGFSGEGAGVNGGDGEGMIMGVGTAYSDSECSPPTWRHCISDANCNTKIGFFAQDPSLPSPENALDKPRPSLRHATSLTYGKESQKIRENFISSLRGVSKPPDDDGEASSPKDRDDREERHSIYDNVPLVICNKSYHDYQSEGTDIDMATQEGSGSSECTMESRESPLPSNHEEEIEDRPVRRATVDRWHSFHRKSSAFGIYSRIGTQISGFSVGQMNHLRKRALLKLTALMERYCPTNRTTWNWELPKFIRKIKSPDYKDRSLFGVPLQVINQRTGYPLPPGIQHALAYLKTSCIDQVGIFRKPGVRSRIQKLRELHENEDDVPYCTFGPCDIADMVKTYFRELPEVLLTNKLSEIFITICQYLPIEVRLEALQCVMLMMPDENREVLMTLLFFLSDVAANARLNQMTASNLSVCMAPSLFHLNMGGSGSSPLRRKTTGSPEQKDLHDNKAAHQCLTLMIQQVSNLQCLPMEMLSNCRFSFLDLSQPVALEDLGSAFNATFVSSQREGDWVVYMNACIDSLLKETREKSRGWVHIGYPDPLVEVGYRKVGDGHPLRLWKVTTEVEAPPSELLTRVLRERHLWDESLLKWRVVARLNRQAEVFQYMCNSLLPRPPIDYCVLRCWRTDLGKGLCVVVETSVEHCDAPLLAGGSRGIILASRYMIQPCGSGKSRITHISRVDMRGRLPEWYNKNYAFFTANHIVKLRQSFQHFATGPESKV